MPEKSVIVIFLHSFNFLNLPYNFKKKKYGKITVNYKLINDFERLLSEIKGFKDTQFSYSEKIFNKKDFRDSVITIKTKNFVLKPIYKKLVTLFGWRGNI